MSLHFPTFANSADDFICLKKDLTAVKWWCEWQELQDQLASIDMQLTNLIQRSGLPHSDVIDLIMTEISKYRQTPHSEVRKSELSLLFHQYRTLRSRELQTIGVKTNLAAIIRDINALYTTPEMEALRSDLTDLFTASTSEQVALTEQINALNEQKKAVTKRIIAHRKAVFSSFNEMPQVFRGQKVPNDTDTADGKVKRIQFAISIVSEFVACWRKRSVLFSEPVSHTGIAIRSMPPERSELWMNAYKSLGFDDLKKVPTFVAQLSHEKPTVKQEPLV